METCSSEHISLAIKTFGSTNSGGTTWISPAHCSCSFQGPALLVWRGRKKKG
jgi:hypothetical protein